MKIFQEGSSHGFFLPLGRHRIVVLVSYFINHSCLVSLLSIFFALVSWAKQVSYSGSVPFFYYVRTRIFKRFQNLLRLENFCSFDVVLTRLLGFWKFLFYGMLHLLRKDYWQYPYKYVLKVAFHVTNFAYYNVGVFFSDTINRIIGLWIFFDFLFLPAENFFSARENNFHDFSAKNH